MALRRWKRLSTELVHENPWWRYRRDTFEREPGVDGEYFYVSTPGSVMIVPVEEEGRYVLVEQYRYLADRFSLEFPAGGIHEGETPLHAAARELAEETGRSGTLVALGAHNPCNGITDELCHVFLATDLVTLPDPPSADATEAFAIHLLSGESLEARIADGTLWDGMSLAAYALHRFGGRR